MPTPAGMLLARLVSVTGPLPCVESVTVSVPRLGVNSCSGRTLNEEGQWYRLPWNSFDAAVHADTSNVGRPVPRNHVRPVSPFSHTMSESGVSDLNCRLAVSAPSPPLM